MRRVREGFTILVIGMGLSAIGARADALVATDGGVSPETALTLTTTAPDGTTKETKLADGQTVLLRSININDLGGQGLSLSEHQVDGKAVTVAQGGGFCLALSTPSNVDSIGQTVTVGEGGRVQAEYSTPGGCWECTFHNGVGLDPHTYECTVPGGNGCGHCEQAPCPEPVRPSCPYCPDPDDPGAGWNSPVIDGAEIGGTAFHELSLSGDAGAAGLRLTNSSILVAAARAQREHGGSETAALIGKSAEIVDAAGERHHIRFAGIGRTAFWAGSKSPVTTYVMTVSSAADPTPRPLCTGARNEAILFTGDRYDAATKSIAATGAGAQGWINVACDGTAPAKLFLMRHTDASEQTPTTRAERQAMLKMLAADVYGDGTSFTVAGQPLLWRDAKGITAFRSTPAAIEAIWNEHGAVCLNVPRRPDREPAIEAHGIRPPRCTEQMLRDTTLGYVVSAHPKL